MPLVRSAIGTSRSKRQHRNTRQPNEKATHRSRKRDKDASEQYHWKERHQKKLHDTRNNSGCIRFVDLLIGQLQRFAAMASNLVPRFFLLLAVATAPSLVKAFLLPSFDQTKTVDVMKSTKKFQSTDSSIESKNGFLIANRGWSSSLTAWRFSFGTASKLPKLGKDGMYHIANEEEYR